MEKEIKKASTKVGLATDVVKPKVVKPRKPSINWKQRAEEAETQIKELENKFRELEKVTAVNTHEVVEIAAQRDHAIKTANKVISDFEAARLIINLGETKNKAISKVLAGLTELNNVIGNYEYVIAVENNIDTGGHVK